LGSSPADFGYTDLGDILISELYLLKINLQLEKRKSTPKIRRKEYKKEL
jgi:hypothetical protein